jgi:hypothetical protein
MTSGSAWAPLRHPSFRLLVTVEYRIPSEDRDGFLEALASIASERRRDGAYDWGVFEDSADAGRVVETFYVDSWIEHVRQHERVTQADRLAEEAVRRYAEATPTVTHLIAVRGRDRQQG